MRSLEDQVNEIFQRLAKKGWEELMACHGIVMLGDDMRSELLREANIDWSQPGFEDFSRDGKRAIEPCRPAQSALFHAVASPQVTSYRNKNGIEVKLSAFPTFEEICVIENYVYGIDPPSLQELRVKAKNFPLAVTVFASEYRPALTTVHQKHADKCFSRVGISRVGNSQAHYLDEARGYLPFDDDDIYKTRVLPTYYSAYIAVKVLGDASNFGPMRIKEKTDKEKGDNNREFWVPLHKLFSGKECIRHVDLQVKLSATHINEKIRKAHLALAGLGYDTGWHEPHISDEPFVIKKGIAELELFENGGEGLLMPVVHQSLVEEAIYDNKILTYITPAGKKPFRSSVNIEPKSTGARYAPEYVHARHQLIDSKIIDLNDAPKVAERVQQGNYKAVHYVDYTGDGCIEVECPALAFYLPEVKPGYSMVSAVDFFPLVKQYDLVNWWTQAVPQKLIDNIWPENPGLPLSLADSRYPANLSLTTTKLDITDENSPKKIFDLSDDTISTVIGSFNSCAGELTKIEPLKTIRMSTLPDGASGIYAPGWDVSIDRTEEIDKNDDGVNFSSGTTYFNNYGLGSPFPEDAMLCAALSSFWPAAAPDITRSFAPGNYASATPLPDDILGMEGGNSWNGIPAPKIIGEGTAEFLNIEYGDFIGPAKENKFDYSKITRITLEEYTASTLVMARVYGALDALTTAQKKIWTVFSFKRSKLSDTERQSAELSAGISLSSDYTYRFEMFKHTGVIQNPNNFRTKLVHFDKIEVLYADPQTVLRKSESGWKPYRY
ncbi:hypothetical protein ACLI09_02680 [Flavobacterium sp. RHBU_24]|uniref:hypothetical protein n=1 Tax=Flavobacterium sp. RHBU_24 TaxID=3391185 RepID=UPI00398517B6